MLTDHGVVRGTEGNLSTSDGEVLLITRTGASLGSLGPSDVLAGTLDEPPEGASSDLAVHLAHYRSEGPGAIVHAHPRGSPQGGPSGAHGVYVRAADLRAAAEEVLAAWPG